jgi:hypothetical protein
MFLHKSRKLKFQGKSNLEASNVTAESNYEPKPRQLGRLPPEDDTDLGDDWERILGGVLATAIVDFGGDAGGFPPARLAFC